MFTHPEVRNQVLIETFALHFANPTWSRDAVDEAAHTKVFLKNLEDTNMLLKELCLCPGLTPPIEDFERALQMEEVLDDVLVVEDEEDF